MPATLLPQSIQDSVWVPNGPVYDIAISGDTVYFGGTFSFVGPSTGHGSAIDLNTGNPNLSYARINDHILAVVSDGLGGWYIGGYFT